MATITQQQRPLGPVSPYMTKQQCADYIGTKKEFVEDLIRSGRLRALRVSYRVLRIDQRDVDALLQASATIATPNSKP
jgi:excisionase family DNA binding protein